jgi:hypothetical protein
MEMYCFSFKVETNRWANSEKQIGFWVFKASTSASSGYGDGSIPYINIHKSCHLWGINIHKSQGRSPAR